MTIVTGNIHVGKTTIIKNTSQSYIIWDEWFEKSLKTKSLQDIVLQCVPIEYTEHVFLLKKYLAITPNVFKNVCQLSAPVFRELAAQYQLIEIPAHVVSYIAESNDKILVLTPPKTDEWISTIVNIRKCNDSQAVNIINSVESIINTLSKSFDMQYCNSEDFANCI